MKQMFFSLKRFVHFQIRGEGRKAIIEFFCSFYKYQIIILVLEHIMYSV